MMAGFHKLKLRQWVLILLAIPIAALFFRERVMGALPSLPTARAIRADQALLKKRREQLQALQEQIDARENQIAELKQMAAPFWLIDDRNAARQKGVVQNEVTRIFTKASIRGVDYQITNPRRQDLPEKTHVYEVEVTVNITASMREIARVLAEVDRSEQALTWSQCSIAPLNLRDTSKVRLTGTLRAVALSPDAAALLRAPEAAAPLHEQSEVAP